MREVLGVDIGGVIIDRVNDNTDTSFFGDNYLKTTAVPGAFDALAHLRQFRFDGNLHLVSKCGQKVQDKTEQWLRHHQFFKLTGVPETNVHFCRERHEKEPICRELGITHFVDDRLEVLSYLTEIVPHLYLFQPRIGEVHKFRQFLSRVNRKHSWQEIVVSMMRQQQTRVVCGND